MTLDIVPRSEWDARPPAGDIDPIVHPVEHVVYTHNLDTAKCDTDEECSQLMRDLQKKQMDEGAPDIHYNFLIGGNGKAYEGRGWWFQSDKSLQYSDYKGDRIDIAFIGNYGKAFMPADNMMQMCETLVMYGIDFDYVKPNYVERVIC